MQYRQKLKDFLFSSTSTSRGKPDRACLSLFRRIVTASSRWAVFVVGGLLVSAAIALGPVQNAAAVTPLADMSPRERAQAFASYKGLRQCLAGGITIDPGTPGASLGAAYKGSFSNPILIPPIFIPNAHMSAEDAVNFDWFHGSRGVIPGVGTIMSNHVIVGVIIDAGLLPSGDRDGVMNCGDGEGRAWIGNLVRLWGYSSGPELLCALGFERAVNQENCAQIVPGAQNDFGAPGGLLALVTATAPAPGNLDRLWTGTLGASSTGVESIGAGEYRLLLDSFKAACRPTAPAVAGSGEYTILEVNPATNRLEPVNYVPSDQNAGPGHSVRIYGGIATSVTATCGQLAEWLGDTTNRAVRAYAEWMRDNLPEEDLGRQSCEQDGTCPPGSYTPTCGSEVTGVGWILCPVLGGLTGLNDGMWSLVRGLLTVDPLDDDGGLYTAWGTLRNIANVAFVIVFLIVVFSQLTGAAISNYGIKKMLPRLIIGVLLVNVSYFVVALAVDLANILGTSLYDLLTGLAPEYDPSVHGWEVLTNLLTQALLAGGLTVAGVALVGGAATAFWMLLPLAAMGALGLLAAVVTLIFRQAAIPVLAILAPLAFVAYLLPNTEQWYKKWQSLLLSMLMLFPLAALVFGGTQFAAMIFIGNGEDWWRLLIGLIMLTLPLFSLPFIARQGGPLLGKVGGALKGLADKARQPLGNWAKGYENLSRARYKSGQPRRGLLGSSQRLYQRAALRKKTRETDTATAEKVFTSQWANSQQGQEATDRAGRAGLQENIDTADAATRLEDATRRDLTLRARQAKQQQEAAGKATERLVREASTGASAPHLNTLDPATRHGLQTSQRSIDVNESAIGSAGRVARTEYATQLTIDPALAADAGGIDPGGAGRVTSAAQAALTKERRERIQNIKDAAPESPSDHASMATALLTAAGAGDVETVSAYSEMLADGGNPGVSALRDALRSAESMLPPDRLQQFKDDVRRTPSITNAGADFDEWTHSDETLADIANQPGTWNRLSPGQFAGMKQSSQELAIAHLSMPTVQAILASPETVNALKPAIRDALIARAGTTDGSGLILPEDEEFNIR